MGRFTDTQTYISIDGQAETGIVNATPGPYEPATGDRTISIGAIVGSIMVAMILKGDTPPAQLVAVVARLKARGGIA